MKSSKKLALCAVMAALIYVAFSYIKIDIPTPTGYTAVHMGNALACLAGLLLNPNLGGLASCIGMGIGDLLDPKYLLTAPKTIILKYIMGFLAGFLGQDIFKLQNKEGKKLYFYTFITIFLTMLTNIILEPLFSYFYYDVILNNANKAASYLTLAKWISTSINGLISILVATPLYILLRKRVAK